MSGSDTTRVLVAGAGGDTGRELLSVLRPTDLAVRATTRSYRDVTLLERLGADEVAIVDAFEPRDVVEAVEGCDVVVSVLGSTPGLRGVTGGKLVDRTGVVNVVTAALAEEIDHFVLQSALGVGDSAGLLPLHARLLRRGVLKAKGDAETALRRSGLGYTIVRPGRLTDQPPSDRVLVGEGGDTVRGSIPRTDVARLLAAAPFTPAARNRTFEVVSRGGLAGTPKNLVDVPWNVSRLGIEDDPPRANP